MRFHWRYPARHTTGSRSCSRHWRHRRTIVRCTCPPSIAILHVGDSLKKLSIQSGNDRTLVNPVSASYRFRTFHWRQSGTCSRKSPSMNSLPYIDGRSLCRDRLSPPPKCEQVCDHETGILILLQSHVAVERNEQPTFHTDLKPTVLSKLDRPRCSNIGP